MAVGESLDGEKELGAAGVVLVFDNLDGRPFDGRGLVGRVGVINPSRLESV